MNRVPMRAAAIKAAYISMLNLPSRMAHGMQVMKNAQAWSKAVADFEFITNVSPLNRLRLDQAEITRLYGLSHGFAIKAYPMQGTVRRFKLPLPEGLFHRLAAARCRGRGVDLVYTRTYLTPRYTLAAGLPTVVETHAPPDDDPQKRDLYGRMDHPLMLGLVTISQDLARRYLDIGIPEDKILVLPDGVDLDAYAKPLSREAARAARGIAGQGPLAVYVGHLYDGRGVEDILTAAGDLPQVRFLLVGGHPPDVARWQKRAGDLGNVEFAGFVDNTLVPSYLWAADVLLMPYGSGCPTVQWMSPLKMFEYMAAGRPIVATDLPSLKEILEHEGNALLCPVDDGLALAGAIRQLIDNPELAQSISARALGDAARYSWDMRVQKILEFARERLRAS